MKKIILSLILFLPQIAYSQFSISYGQPRTILDVIYSNIMPILKMLPGILIGVAFIVFVWGIIRYILANGEKDKKESIGVITFGILAITVISAIWGIVFFFLNEFGISNNPILERDPAPILNR